MAVALLFILCLMVDGSVIAFISIGSKGGRIVDSSGRESTESSENRFFDKLPFKLLSISCLCCLVCSQTFETHEFACELHALNRYVLRN